MIENIKVVGFIIVEAAIYAIALIGFISLDKVIPF